MLLKSLDIAVYGAGSCEERHDTQGYFWRIACEACGVGISHEEEWVQDEVYDPFQGDSVIRTGGHVPFHPVAVGRKAPGVTLV